MTVGSQVRGTLVSLQSIEAILTTLALKTTEKEAKESFHQASLKTRTVIDQVTKRLGQLEYEEPQYVQK
ncbi:DUF1657 domain-containing protein [bacterium LRH843]|nr:DUF1657 domain-containing protein [bacterium LRH843]